jgi:IS5 family transposase
MLGAPGISTGLMVAPVSEAQVDMGYCGHDYEGAVTVRADRRQRGRTLRPLWRWMNRRAAVEPSIGHPKTKHRLERTRLKGVAGDVIYAVLRAAAINLQKLLGAFWRNLLRGPLGRWEQFQLIQALIGSRTLCAEIRI